MKTTLVKKYNPNGEVNLVKSAQHRAVEPKYIISFKFEFYMVWYFSYGGRQLLNRSVANTLKTSDGILFQSAEQFYFIANLKR